MEFKKCEQCGRYGFTDTHKCAPRWAVFLDDYPEPASIYAENSKDACAQYAAEHDNGDYHLLNGNELTVAVAIWSQWQDARETQSSLETWIGALPHFLCTAQLVPEYSANRIGK